MVVHAKELNFVMAISNDCPGEGVCVGTFGWVMEALGDGTLVVAWIVDKNIVKSVVHDPAHYMLVAPAPARSDGSDPPPLESML